MVWIRNRIVLSTGGDSLKGESCGVLIRGFDWFLFLEGYCVFWFWL